MKRFARAIHSSIIPLLAIRLTAIGLLGCGPVNPSNQNNTGGAGGAGGMGGMGGGSECPVGMTRSCYTGPTGTENVGMCKSGTQLCSGDGKWSDCFDDTLPVSEVCLDKVDNDCDGTLNDHCEDATMWAKRFGNSSDEWGTSIATDAAGNVYFNAWGQDTDFGGGPLPLGYALVKLDPSCPPERTTSSSSSTRHEGVLAFPGDYAA